MDKQARQEDCGKNECNQLTTYNQLKVVPSTSTSTGTLGLKALAAEPDVGPEALVAEPPPLRLSNQIVFFNSIKFNSKRKGEESEDAR